MCAFGAHTVSEQEKREVCEHTEEGQTMQRRNERREVASFKMMAVSADIENVNSTVFALTHKKMAS